MAALHLSPSIPRRPSLRHLPAALGLALWGVGLLVWPGFVRDSVAQSTLYCITSLVPPCFPLWFWSAPVCAPQEERLWESSSPP